MKGFILGFITGVLVFTALHYQFIITKKDVVVSTKGEIGFVDTLVDTRNWGPGDYLKHPKVVLALRKKGLGSMFEKAGKQVSKEVNQTVADVEKAGKKAASDVKKAASDVKKTAREVGAAAGGASDALEGTEAGQEE